MTIGKRPLPPPIPNRGLSGVRPKEEPVTKPKGVSIAIYQGLLSVFDEMTDDQRLAFVELAYVYGQLSDHDRATLLELANRLRGED